MLAFLPSCSTVTSVTDTVLGTGGPQPGQPGYVAGFLGGIVADEPRAALAGREVLSSGGTAGDAAVAVALTLAVTLPSRAGLGGGGACIAYSPSVKTQAGGVPEAVMFTAPAPAEPGARADRPAAIPMLARGLFLLHARYGAQPFEFLVSSAEQMARFGIPASRALVSDLRLVSGPLLTDPGARSVFSQNGVPLSEGQTLRQPDLGSTFAQIRVSGVGDMTRAPWRGGSSNPPPLRAGRSAWRICGGRCRNWRRRCSPTTAMTGWRSCRRRPMAASARTPRSACWRPTRTTSATPGPVPWQWWSATGPAA